MVMNKAELIEAIANGSGLTKVAVSKMVDVFSETIIDALKKGEQVVIPKFGTFLTADRAARTGRNPQTGQVIEIKASRVAKFKAGKLLKESVQES